MQSLAYVSPAVYGLLVLAAVLYAWAARFAWIARADRRRALELLESDARVDPWAMQEDVMRRSGQRMPASPRLHNGVLLYACLNMEELGETLAALGDAVARHCDVTDPRTGFLSLEFRKLGQAMQARSLSIRATLRELDVGTHPLCPESAKALLDGTSDLTVTNSGFAVACGFPGAAAYAEVQDSNLSKANPATGAIDKTPDGKWIKGANYREPNLLAVLANACPLWASQMGMRPDGTFFAELR